MSDIELVITQSKRFEAFLEKHLGATGKGLHEKVGSVERKLPDALVRRLRFIATIRNKVVHEENYDRIDDRKGFTDACSIAHAELCKIAGVRQGISKWKMVAALLVIAAAAWLVFKYVL